MKSRVLLKNAVQAYPFSLRITWQIGRSNNTEQYTNKKNNTAPSTLATLFNHMWPRIVPDPSTLGRHVAATCMLCMQTLCLWQGRATACRTLEPQTAVCSPKLENNGFLRE